MLEFLIVLIFASGAIGGTYIIVMVPAFFIIKAIRHFVVNYFELAALLVPIALYVILIHAVNDRQGFNWGFANLIIALPAVITLYLGTCNPIAYWIGLILTMITAYIVWLLMPAQNLKVM